MLNLKRFFVALVMGGVMSVFSLSAQAQGAPASTPTNAPQTQSLADAPETTTDAAESYHLGTGDKVKMTVFGQDDLGGEFLVDDQGFIRLPLIGQVKAGGLTIREFEDAVTAKLADGYLRDPRVSVEVTNYRPFYIIGEVNKPGEYPYVNGMNVLNAVALAGGYTYRADDSVVYVRRKGNPVEEKDPADQTTQISPGDIIRVAERFF